MDIRDLEQTLKAFANKRRIAILRYVRLHKEASVGDIAEEIKLSFRTTSKHLAILSAAKIIQREQNGLRAAYSLSRTMSDTSRKILALL